MNVSLYFCLFLFSFIISNWSVCWSVVIQILSFSLSLSISLTPFSCQRLVHHPFIFMLSSRSSSLRSHSQDCSVCQDDLINTIRRHVCSLVLMRSITSFAIMLLCLLSVRRLQKGGARHRQRARYTEVHEVGLCRCGMVVWVCLRVWHWGMSVCVVLCLKR